MDADELQLGAVPELHAQSFGEPGNRTFRLYMDVGSGNISLWLEKQQIVALLAAVEEILERVGEASGNVPTAEAVRAFSGEVDVRVGSLAISFDPQVEGFVIRASDLDSPFNLDHIDLVASRSQFITLRDELETIVGQSRPRCPLCGTPLTGAPHFCPPSNGHAHVTLEDA